MNQLMNQLMNPSINHHGYLEDVSFQIIDRILGDSKPREGFWQFKLDGFISEGRKSRFADL